MNRPTPSDEAVSAHLDGEATPREAAAVTASPAAQTRLTELEAVRALVAEPVAAPAGAREAALAAAIAVFNHETGESDDEAHAAVSVEAGSRVPTGASRRRRWLPSGRVAAAASTAAAVLIIVSVVGLLSSGRTTNDNLATSDGRAAVEQDAGSVSRPGAPSLPGTLPAPSAAGPAGGLAGEETFTERDQRSSASSALVIIGTVTDGADLAHAVRVAVHGTKAGSASPVPADRATDDPRACEAARRVGEKGLGELVLAGTAIYDEVPAGVLVFRRIEGGKLYAYLSQPGTCQLLLSAGPI